MIRTIIQLPEEVHNQLREMAHQERISISAVCREAINDYLKSKGDTKMLNQRTLEIIEETGKIPVSTVDNLEKLQRELKAAGYVSYLDASTDYLVVEKL